ncbi:MAG: hypothetical protein HYX82_03715 [Chloroflexi bacterium]|nr:hypothetical protein [Chloroflexota bacterium]
MQKRWRYLIAAILAGLGVLTFVACSPSARAQLEGVLQDVDSISGEVTVTLKDGGTITFNLNDVNVETLRQAVGNASFEEGAQVTLETDRDNKVKAVKARHAKVEGDIKAVDNDKKTLTITAENGVDVTLEVTETTRFKARHGDSASFASLREGQEVEAKYDVETKKALEIKIEDRQRDEVRQREAEVGEDSSLTGVIEALTADMVVVGGKTFKIDADTALDNGLAVGVLAKVEFVLQADGSLLALEVETDAPDEAEAEAKFKGTITAINKDANTITIRSRNGIEAIYKVTASTRFELDGVGTLEGLQVGMEVEVKFNPTNSELIKLEIED